MTNNNSTICPSCDGVDTIEYDNVGSTFTYVCRVCGHVQEENVITTDKVEFSKNDSSQMPTVQGHNYSYRDAQMGGFLMGYYRGNMGGGGRGGGMGGGSRNVISEAIRNDPKANAQQRQAKARNQLYDRINKICYALKMPEYNTDQVKYLLDQMLHTHNQRFMAKLNQQQLQLQQQKNEEQGSLYTSDDAYIDGQDEYYYEDEAYFDDDYCAADDTYQISIEQDQQSQQQQQQQNSKKRKKNGELSKRGILAYSQMKRMKYISAACIYIICRQNKKPITLLDIAEQVQLNVFKLGKEYRNVLQTCGISIDALEPEILCEKYIHQGMFSDPPLFSKMENFQTKGSPFQSIANSGQHITTGNNDSISPSGASAYDNLYQDDTYYSDYMNDTDEYAYYDEGEENGNGYYGGSSIHLDEQNAVMTDMQMHELMSITVRLVRLASKEWINTGRKPQAIVGAAIKICAEAMGFKVRFDVLAKNTASGQVALRDRHREMLALLTSMSSSLPWAKNLNAKTIPKQLPYILRYCEALRELHKAKIDFSIKTENNTAPIKTEDQEVIVLSDSDDDDDDAVVSVVQQEKPCDSNKENNGSQKYVIPQDHLLKVAENKTRVDSIKQINEIVFNGTEALPHAFVKAQLEKQRRLMKIKEAKNRLSQMVKVPESEDNEPKDEPKDEDQISDDVIPQPCPSTTQETALVLLLSSNQAKNEDQNVPLLVPPPSISSYEASLMQKEQQQLLGQYHSSESDDEYSRRRHSRGRRASNRRTRSTKKGVTATSTAPTSQLMYSTIARSGLQSAVAAAAATTTVNNSSASTTRSSSSITNPKKRTLDAEDLEIQRLLLNGVDEQLLESGNYLRASSDTALQLTAPISAYLSENLGEHDIRDEDMHEYLKSQDEVEIYKMFYRELGDDIDGETTINRRMRKKQRVE